MNEIKIWKNPQLPQQTMIVSPDLYNLFTLSTEEITEKQKSEMQEFQNMFELFKHRIYKSGE